jgi:hypothetical protein
MRTSINTPEYPGTMPDLTLDEAAQWPECHPPHHPSLDL